MATVLQLRRGTTSEHSTFTGAAGEVTVDTTKDTLVVHDGSLAGGYPLAKESYVDTAISNLVGGASAAFDTLKEIQDAMATDAELAAAIAALVIGNATQTITAGSYLTGGGSFTANQTSNSSVTLNVDATSANTASKVVARDASGNFSAGTITASLSGNASTVTNGVYTTDTGTVTNTMLAGSITNAKLVNSSITLAGTSVSLGGSFTATNMLDAIKTVDGTGSGLDADLLDGQSSAYFRINIYNAAGTLLN